MTTAASLGRPVDFLLVEDSPSDAGLTLAALKNAEAAINVHLVEDGEEAMRFLRHGDCYASVPRNDVILFDLNMRLS
jgi:CheY-like chemotaxis protein